jgi:uncharacterized protein YndB with AHSA1/START domain
MTDTSTNQDSFTTTVSVEESPEAVFAAIANPRGWWSENIDGPTDQPGSEFTYHHQDVHRSTIRVAEMTSPNRIVWQVIHNHFNFTDDAAEWTGTEIHFTHLGLVPAYECFEVCSGSWDFYLQTSLRGLIRTGQGLPNPLEQPAS